jgi:hypothetical protein
MPNGLYRQTCRGKTGNRPIERIRRKKIESSGKPDFFVVYALGSNFFVPQVREAFVEFACTNEDLGLLA